MFEGGSRIVFRLSGTGTVGRHPARLYRALRARPREARPRHPGRPRRPDPGRRGGRRHPRPHRARQAERDHLSRQDGPGTAPLGVRPTPDGLAVAVWSGTAERVWACVFDGEGEAARHELARAEGGRFEATTRPPSAPVPATASAPTAPTAPERGLWFDPAKLLVDPYAAAIDRPFA